MTIDDLPDVYHLGDRLFTSAAAPLLYRTWDEYEITDYFNTSPDLCLVAEREGRTLGFVIGTTFRKPRTAWTYGYIAWIGVRKNYQHTNIGRRLYDAEEDRMSKEGARMIIMDTEGSNQRAIRFFRKRGFTQAKMHLWLTKTLKSLGKPAPRSRRPRSAWRKRRKRPLH